MNKSEIAEKAAREFKAWKLSLPKCIGGEAGCDGDLVGLPHEDNCPMFGKEFATHKDAFFAGFERAIVAARRGAFNEVESFIAGNGRNADIQSFVEKKICEGERAIAESQAPQPDGDMCPKCTGSKDMPLCSDMFHSPAGVRQTNDVPAELEAKWCCDGKQASGEDLHNPDCRYHHSNWKPLNPPPTPDSKIRQALMTHWLSQIECNHYEKSDSAICACGWKSERGFNVGKAVEFWIDHVFAELG